MVLSRRGLGYVASALLLAVLLLPAAASALKQVGPYNIYTGDSAGNEVTVFKPGDMVYVWVVNNQAADAVVRLDVNILDPNGNPVASYSEQKPVPRSGGKAPMIIWQVPVDAPTGKYTLQFTLQDNMGNSFRDSIYFTVTLAAPAQQAQRPQRQQPQQGTGMASWAIIALAVGVAVIIIAVALLLSRGKKPAEQQAQPPAAPAGGAASSPVPPPPPSAGGATGGETMVVPGGGPAPGAAAAGAGGETVVALARLVAPDGSVIPITSNRQAFGREDFQHLLPPDKARLISRRSKPHFVIYYDFSRNQFFIEDNWSANGTLLNGKQIKGMGPQPLKDGDVISPAGVIDLTFKVG